MLNPLRALLAAPLIQRIGFHAKRIGGQMDRHFFVSLLTAVVGFVLVAAIGFFILPAKRQKAKEEMRKKIADVRARLSQALRKQFSAEIQRSGDRIRESIAPYSRFIRAEGEKLKDVDSELSEISSAITSLRARIERRAA